MAAWCHGTAKVSILPCSTILVVATTATIIAVAPLNTGIIVKRLLWYTRLYHWGENNVYREALLLLLSLHHHHNHIIVAIDTLIIDITCWTPTAVYQITLSLRHLKSSDEGGIIFILLMKTQRNNMYEIGSSASKYAQNVVKIWT